MRKPACLPEQLLCSWQGASWLQVRRVFSALSQGMCTPQRRSPSPMPRSESQLATASRCSAAPEWLAQASASWRSLSPAASAAPLSSSGRACSILHEERGKITASGSPQASSTPPGPNTTAWPACTDSSSPPRQSSIIGTAVMIYSSRMREFPPSGLSPTGTFALSVEYRVEIASAIAKKGQRPRGGFRGTGSWRL